MVSIVKYFLVANGFLLPSSIIREIAQESIIVALDGAANKLAGIGIKPNIIIGDFDSIEEDREVAHLWGIKKESGENVKESQSIFDEPYLGNFGVMIVPAKNQNYTDLQKALKFIKYHVHDYDYPRSSSIHIASSPGLRMDHELANVFTLKQEYEPNVPIYLHGEYQSLEYVANATTIMKGQPGDYCGIFGMPNASMSILNAGLEYGGVDSYPLSLIQHSSSNRMLLENASVQIEGEALIAHPPMFTAQRNFFHKNRQEQLLELLQDANRKLYMGKVGDCCYAMQNINTQNIFCVSHAMNSLNNLNRNEIILLSIPSEKYPIFLSMLPQKKRLHFSTIFQGKKKKNLSTEELPIVPDKKNLNS